MQRVPEGSRLVSTETGRVTAGAHEGRRAIVELWEGQASLGYHSDYRAVSCRWLVVTVYGEQRRPSGEFERQRRIVRYSGNRLDRARPAFVEAVGRLTRKTGDVA